MAADTDHAADATALSPASAALALGALGVVYGDIGTNPLFAMRDAFLGPHRVGVARDNVLGLLSLIFWSLVVVISVKYLGFVMRADNDGEGGIIALSSLVTKPDAWFPSRRWILLACGLLGAGMLYADGVITPSISVLAALEGTTIAAPGLHSFVIPGAIVVLVGLFTLQHKGTATIGSLFGPVMLVWFATIGTLGALRIVDRPEVLEAIVPTHAVMFFASNGVRGFLVLSTVILVFVGGEALYADLGHFGRTPIRMGWYLVVLPSLLLVYFGQGALLLANPATVDNPFYRLGPSWTVIPLVVLATAATIIASQALITGAFSLTHQAVQLGYSPRVRIRHTSAAHRGQIYVPTINWLLLIACIGLVVGFRRSEHLAAAYGLAVTTTMVITSVLFAVVAVERFRWKPVVAFAVCGLFLAVDVTFFASSLTKIAHGAWLPVVIGSAIFTLLSTWRTGKLLVRRRVQRKGLPLERFVDDLPAGEPVRTPGTGVYLYATRGVTPPTLLANVRHNDALHEQVIVVNVVTDTRPRIPAVRRAEIADLGRGFHVVLLRFGFTEAPNVPKALASRVQMELGCDMGTLTYFVGRESVRSTTRPGMARWRERMFGVMLRNAQSASDYFHLPAEQTIELGVVVEI